MLAEECGMTAKESGSGSFSPSLRLARTAGPQRLCFIFLSCRSIIVSFLIYSITTIKHDKGYVSSE